MNNLPKDLNDAIFSLKTFEILKGYWIDFKLDEKQQRELGGETGLYMSGQTKKDRFVPNLMYRLDVNRGTAEEIAARIGKDIIDPVRESFIKAQNDDLEEVSQREVSIETEVAEQPTAVTEEPVATPQAPAAPEQAIPREITPPKDPLESVPEKDIDAKAEELREKLLKIKSTTHEKLPQEEILPSMTVQEAPRSAPRSENASPEQSITNEQVDKKEVLETVERVNQDVTPTGVYGYSNHAPLNVVKEDVLKGIEDPILDSEQSEESIEGTALDSKLDKILKKPRQNDPPQNLPTGTGNMGTTPVAQAPQKKIRGNYTDGQDPYREPID